MFLMIFDLDGVFHSLPVKPGDVSTMKVQNTHTYLTKLHDLYK